MSDENRIALAVVEARLDSQDRAIAALKNGQELVAAQARADAKEILAAITQTNLSVVVLPKWEDLKTIQAANEARLASLEATREQQKGGWKVLAAVGTVCATVGGWLGSLFGK